MIASTPMVRPARLLQMSLETDTAGPVIDDAVHDLVQAGELTSLLRILHGAPVDCAAADEAWALLETPDTLRRILERESPDFEALDLLLPRLGLAAVEPMLATLANSEALPIRRQLFSRLSRLGPEVGKAAVRHLRDSRWYVQRNMLALMGELDHWPERWTPSQLADAPHPAVRREALKLMLRVPEHWDLAVVGLLRDEDPRTVALGLAAAVESAPADAIDMLIGYAEDEDLPPELRVLAIRALEANGARSAIPTLMLLCGEKRWPRGRKTRATEKTSVMLAALRALYDLAYEDDEARQLLDAAAASDDPEIRAAARGLTER